MYMPTKRRKNKNKSKTKMRRRNNTNTRRTRKRRGGAALGKPLGISLNASPSSNMNENVLPHNYTNFAPLSGIKPKKYVGPIIYSLETDETGISAYEGNINDLFHVYPRLAIQQLVGMKEPELTESLNQLGYIDTSNLRSKIRDITNIDEIYKEYEKIVYGQLEDNEILIVDYDLNTGEPFDERRLVVKNDDPDIHYYTFAEFKESLQDEDEDVQLSTEANRTPNATAVSSSSPIQINSLARRTLKKGYNYYKRATLLFSPDDSKTLYKFKNKKEHGDDYLFELFKVDWRLAVNKLVTITDDRQFERLAGPFKKCSKKYEIDNQYEKDGSNIYHNIVDIRKLKNNKIQPKRGTKESNINDSYKFINENKGLCGYVYAYDKEGAFVPLDDTDNLLRQISQGPGLILSTYENAKHYRTIYRYKQKYGKKYLIHLFLIDPKIAFKILFMYYRDNRGLYNRELEILAGEFIDIKITSGDLKKVMGDELKKDMREYINYSANSAAVSMEKIEEKYKKLVDGLNPSKAITLG